MHRRALLAGMASAGVAGLAGCLGSASDDAGRLTVETLAVGGSPGGEMVVRPEGEPALLDFWATWCAPCKPQMAELRTVVERFPDLHVLSITNESEQDAVRAFWHEYEGTWPVALDPDLATNDRFDVTRIPTLLLLDADGSERWRHVGLAAADTIAAEVESL